MHERVKSILVIACVVCALGRSQRDAAHGTDPAKSTGWQEHRIRQGDGQGGWVTRPALRQVLRHPDATHTMPFGLAQMDNGEIAILCSREKQPAQGARTFEPIIAFSKDGGATWSDFSIIPGTKGRPQYLEWLGGGRLSFITEVFGAGKPQRIFSNDYGRTWTERVNHPPTKGGMSFGVEGNAWIDRDEHGAAKAILELGWHLLPGKSHPKGDFTVVFRRSVDGGKTWIDEVSPPQWKFTVEHNGKKWLRGVSEGAIVRAANGDLVAALRTDMPPRYFDEKNDDSLEGTSISISSDDGQTWSEMQFLFDAGRHHANLQRLANGDLVCTLIVRDDIQKGKLASHRRGCDALISKDHGKSWNLDRRLELDRYDYLRPDGYWVDGVCGHIGAVVLDDGHILSVYGNYPLGAMLIKWKPDAEPAQAVPKVAVLIGPNANELDHFAADELAGYLGKLFDIDARLATEGPSTADVLLLIGTPETNPAVAKALGKDGWPKVSDQGIVLKKATLEGKPALVVGGGSSAATLWAVYELVERWGVRYLHNRDVYPAPGAWPGLPQSDDVLEPNLRIRCWRMVNDLPFGPVSWSPEENQRFLRQMAKMKFNRVRVQLWPAQPFVHYTIRGVAKPKGTIYFGHHFPIDADTVGREKFGDLTEFTNPEFVGAETADELHRRAARLVRGIFDEARRLGMETALAFEPAEWPKEFQTVLPGTEPVHQLGSLTIGPGANQSMDDPLLREATATVIKAYLETYPDVDHLILSMPEHGHWVGQAEEAYRRLVKTYDVKDLDSFDTLCARARSRTSFPGGGARVERQLKSDLSSLWFLDSLVREHKLLKRPDGGPDIKLVYDSLTDELFPLVAQVAPPGGQVVSFIDYTASRQLQRRDLLQRVPPKQVPAGLIFTLADDNVGVLPQLATGSLHELMGLLRQHEWAGFYTRYWTIGDLDPTIHFLARGSWNASLTPRDAYADQVRQVCGSAAVEPALAAFALIEKITLGLDQHGLGFGFPVPGMMTKHYNAGGLSAEIQQDQQSYREALRRMKEAHAASRPEGRDYTRYFVNRLWFAVRYLDAAESFGATARSLKADQKSAALDHANQAYEAIREALQAYADVARDHGDLGAIAAMNEYCYRPIRDKHRALKASGVNR